MQFAATYPLAQIRRVQIYNNIKRYRETELDKILQETGGSFVFGGPIFLSDLSACCHLKGDGVVYGAPDYHVWGMAWGTDAQDYAMEWLSSWRGSRWRHPTISRTWAAGGPAKPSAPRRGGLPISSPRRPTPRRSCGTCWRPPAGTAR